MLTFFHMPQTRSTGIRMLLDELGAPHDMSVMDGKAGQNREPAYLAVNPLGKVPAIVDDGALVTEQGAICLYLADKFPAAGLAPPIGDPLRGPYLRWLFLYGSAFEPAVVDRAMKREPGHAAMSPYGSYDAVMATVTTQLTPGPWLLGDTFTAADVLWGMALDWTTKFGLVPADPVIAAYVACVTARPSYISATDGDKALLAIHAPPE